MRHRKKSEKFSRSRAQRKALVKSLLRAMVIYESIKTTSSKAKAISASMDKLITLAKRTDLHARRLAYSRLGDHKLVKKLFDETAPRFEGLNSGYTRVINLGYRKGDGALMSIVELMRLKEKKKPKAGKAKVKAKDVEKDKAAIDIPKSNKPKKKFIPGIRNIFKKEK